ncbi:MAG: dynamin family protein [Pseudomonadota bacterium]
MTQDYAVIRSELLDTVQRLSSLYALPKRLPGMADTSFSEWNSACDVIRGQLSEDLLRVAVVGAIKSGKSTFVNSLFGGDYLKRGAGVVTSIVTRVRYGEALKATLFFKSWDDVNRDIKGALVLLPNLNLSRETGSFDIRRSADRKALGEALGCLGPEQLITQDARNANGVLLYSYLKGYDRVKERIGPEPLTAVFGEDTFDAHRAFAGEDALAVYLTDIELEIASPHVADQIEIADCQGSDSPNPLHLAMIQDYLNLTHMIVYVISSRTGLRRADIRFLSIIKKMGILDNTIFVINCDFSEHGSLDDLSALVKKTVEELSLIKSLPQVFCLSALFNLFRSMPSHLSEKDSRRYAQWQTDKELTDFSDDNSAAFFSTFKAKLTAERQAVLLGNHLERIERMISGVKHWQEINRKIIAKDTRSAAEIARRIEAFRDRMAQIRSTMHSTIDGAVSRIKRELKTQIDQFFGDRSSGITATITHFIRSYEVVPGDYEAELTQRGFNATMYQVFQDFRQRLDTFMAENINPQILGYVRGREKKLEQDLTSLSSPYDSLIHDAIAEFGRGMTEIGIPPMGGMSAGTDLPDVESIKRIAGIKFPPMVVAMRYSARIKTEAVLRLGFYTALTFLKQILKKPLQGEKEKEMSALSDGIRRMRRETEKTILFHFIDYKENLKFQYILKLVDAVSHTVKATLLHRFESYVESLVQLLSLIGNKQLDEVRAAEVLDEMAACTSRIEAGLRKIRGQNGLGKWDGNDGKRQAESAEEGRGMP